MSLAALAEHYRAYPQVSLKRFAAAAGVAYYRLRDFIHSEQRRQQRERRENELKQVVKQAALAFPTYGHRPLQRELLARGVRIGREKVRDILAELGLSVQAVKKPRRAAPAITAPVDYPPGRRVQIDVTQVQLRSGKAWLYLVEDVPSRVLLAIRAVLNLSKEGAREVLAEAVDRLRTLGIDEPLVIQSDGGSDFISGVFQAYCDKVGCWIRSKVNQKGGMGILERLNRTFKYEWLFRHECGTLVELQALADRFERWYNHQRRHSLAYQTPWSCLSEGAQGLNSEDLRHESSAIEAEPHSDTNAVLPNEVSFRALLQGPCFTQIEDPKTLGSMIDVQDSNNQTFVMERQGLIRVR